MRKLMSKMKLISKQPGSHAYKKPTVERPDIPNVLDNRGKCLGNRFVQQCWAAAPKLRKCFYTLWADFCL